MDVMEFRKLTLMVVFVWMAFLAHGQRDASKYSCGKGEVAFDGYDVVSYYEDGPVKGISQYQTTYDGIVLYFKSDDNLKKFKAAPLKYMPAYGGWCATGVAHDNLVVPNFAMYKIQNDQLLFFEVRGFFNGLSQWEKDSLKNEFIADKNYREALKKAQKSGAVTRLDGYKKQSPIRDDGVLSFSQLWNCIRM